MFDDGDIVQNRSGEEFVVTVVSGDLVYCKDHAGQNTVLLAQNCVKVGVQK